MAGSSSSGGDPSRFAEEARAAGLALPTARRLNPKLAAGAFAVVVAASLLIGYSTGWVNLSRPHPNPLAELPGCSRSGIAVDVPTESASSVGLANGWPAVAAGFSAATGGCLSVNATSTASGLPQLAAEGIDALVGPQLPGTAPPANLTGETYDVPLLVSPLVVVVNAEGLPQELNLSVAALAGAYLGTVTSWAAPSLSVDNPGLASGLNVTVVYLDGPSEANLLFSTYLAGDNATFRASVAPGTNVSWPVGEAASSPSMAETLIAATPGAIGYEPTDVCPSLPHGLVCALVQDGAGGFVAPTLAEVDAAAELEANSSAAAAGNWVNASGVAPPGSTVYPVVETTFAVVYRDLGISYGSTLGLNASKWLIALLFWVASDTSGTAGAIAETYGYDPLPGGLATVAEETALSVTYLGNWILLPPTAVEGSGEGGEGGGETGEF